MPDNVTPPTAADLPAVSLAELDRLPAFCADLAEVSKLVRRRYELNEQAALDEFHTLEFYEKLDAVTDAFLRLLQAARLALTQEGRALELEQRVQELEAQVYLYHNALTGMTGLHGEGCDCVGCDVLNPETLSDAVDAIMVCEEAAKLEKEQKK